MNGARHDLKMPSFGADMAKGTLVEWQVKKGDIIKRGDVIAVIETHKGAIDLDVFEDAIVEELLIKEGQQVTVGTAIATLRTMNDSLETPSRQQHIDEHSNKTEPAEKVQINNTLTETHQPKAALDSDFILASPAARALAAQQQLSLSRLAAENSQPLTLTMVKKAITKTEEAEPPIQEKSAQRKSGFDKNAMRQAISDTVTRSKQQIPHYYLSQRLDISALQSYLQNYNAQISVESRLLLNAPLLCAIARTLKTNPQLNGIYQDQQFIPSDSINLANAINLRGGGLVMPVIRDAQSLSAAAMMQQLKEQVARARTESLRASEMSNGSCTVTSIGDRGAEQMFAVIYPPQVAIIALGAPHQEALVIDDNIQIRSIINATIAADHRVSDGQVGARFLYQLNQLLQQPEQLWQE
ncbi:dihydrolipoamide acetyltransferase family protein [Psychromonas sp. MME2]|uniref:dihydrolipoamide acetyltransferase family protein n=1 Tax=unclassified Psychromonas TaxID=2614957 RepID=UPI00339CBF7D